MVCHKIAPFNYSGWHEPTTGLRFLVDQEANGKLPEKYKEILKVAMKTASYDMYIENYHMSSEAWASIQEDYPNIKIKTLPDEVISAMVDSNDALVVQYKNENPMFKKIIESQEAYMKKSREWTHISDYLYLKSISDEAK